MLRCRLYCALEDRAGVITPQLFCALLLVQVLLACLLDMSCVQRGGSLVVPWMGLGWGLVASWANCDCDLNIL